MAILKNVGYLKTSTIDEIKDNFDGAQGVVVVNYSGLTVEQDTQLRKQLREAGVVYKVYKNTLVKRVVAGTEFEPITDALEGTNAIAFCKTDATAPARILANFAKTANALELKCGVVEGTFYDAKQVSLQSLLSLQERNFFQSYLEVSSHLLQTLLVLLSRLLRRTRKLLNQFNTELTMKAA